MLIFLYYSSRVMLDLDKFHDCIEICQISRTKWTPVNEQNKAASKLSLRLAATHGTCGFVNGRPVNSGETIARFANGRGNLFGAAPDGL